MCLPEFARMELTYELTKIDFLQAIVAHRNRSWLYGLLTAALLITFALFVLWLVTRASSTTVADLTVAMAILLYLIVFVWGIPRWTARSQFSRQPSAHGTRTMLLDGTGIHWRWNGGSSDIQWSTFIKWLESKNQFLLYSSPACLNMVPKRVLTPEQLVELRALLTKNIRSL